MFLFYQVCFNHLLAKACLSYWSGNKLSPELIQTISKLAPTTDEELKLRLYCGEISQLGPAERFLKSLVEIPFAFKRMDALLLMSSLQEEVTSIKESFETLEVNRGILSLSYLRCSSLKWNFSVILLQPSRPNYTIHHIINSVKI